MKRLAICILLSCPGLCPQASGQGSGIIVTVAGGTPFTFPNNVNIALNAPLGNIPAVAIDSRGNIYVADLEATTESSSLALLVAFGLIAGNGTTGFSGDGGPATSASLNLTSYGTGVAGVAIDSSGNLFIADAGNGRIRKVSASGIITTFAALGQIGGIAVDGSGNLFVSELVRIQKFSPSGITTTVAGNGSQGFSGDGGPATGASLNLALGVAVDASGDLFITDWGNSRIRKVWASGIITTVAGNGAQGFSGDGGPAPSASLNLNVGEINSGADLVVDPSRKLYIADAGNERIRKVSANGIITTVAGNATVGFAGDGLPATSASLYAPEGVAVDASGNLFIADFNNERVREGHHQYSALNP